jgi:hypothetical protein
MRAFRTRLVGSYEKVAGLLGDFAGVLIVGHDSSFWGISPLRDWALTEGANSESMELLYSAYPAGPVSLGKCGSEN